MKDKGTRVWVAVNYRGQPMPWLSDKKRSGAELRVHASWFYDDYLQGTLTIRRATLVLDPVKPRKPKRFQSSAFKAAHELAIRKRKGAA